MVESENALQSILDALQSEELRYTEAIMEAYRTELRCKYKFEEEFANTYEAAWKIESEWKKSHD